MESQFRLSLSVKEYTNARKSSAKWQPDKRLIFVWPGLSIRFYSRVQKIGSKRGDDWQLFRRKWVYLKGLHEMAIIFNDRQAWWGSDLYLKCWDGGTRIVVQIWNLLRNCGAVLIVIRDHFYIDNYDCNYVIIIIRRGTCDRRNMGLNPGDWPL